MKYAKLGNSEIEVSRLCVGCMSFGEHIEGGHQWTLDQNATQEMVKHALEVGINFFDTAPPTPMPGAPARSFWAGR